MRRLFPRGEGGFELLSKAEFTSQALGGVSTALILSLTAEGGFDAHCRAGREAGRGGRCSDTTLWVL